VIEFPKPWPVFRTGCGLLHYTWDPVLHLKYFYNFSKFMPDSLAMLLNPNQWHIMQQFWFY
jgi:hypothetical protein